MERCVLDDINGMFDDLDRDGGGTLSMEDCVSNSARENMKDNVDKKKKKHGLFMIGGK